MEILVLVVVAAALVGGVIWNHKNAQAAHEGVRLRLDRSTSDVVAAMNAEFCVGAKAKARNLLAGMSVQPAGVRSFTYKSKLGDTGTIVVTDDGANASLLTASTDRLFVGAPDKFIPNKGIFVLSYNIVNLAYRMLGIAPGAGKAKRFNRKVDTRLRRRLGKTVPASA